MSIHEFIQLNKENQKLLLEEKGLCFDVFNEKENSVYLYFLYGFFVEVVTPPGSNKSEIIPFKKGFRFTAQPEA
jgi:hypothetical protein